MNLLAIKNLSSVVCYAVAAGLILILGLGFFVTLLRHKRTRKWYDVCMLILAFVVLFAGLVVGAFAVICKYKPLSLECARLDKKLLFLRKDKKLFSVPAIGYAVTLFEKLALAGLIVPFAVAFLALLTIIVIFAKTKKKKKVVKTAVKTGESDAPAEDYAKSAAQSAKTSDVSYAERDTVSHETREKVAHEHREGVEHETREQLTHAEESYLAGGEKPQLAAREHIAEEDPIDEKEIMDEVSKLMDESIDADNVDGDLARAIEEGYAMIDDFAEEKIDYELADDEEEVSETEGEEEPLGEEDAQEAAETEDVLYEETEEAEDVLDLEAEAYDVEESEEAFEAEAYDAEESEEAFEEEAEDADEYASPIEEAEEEEEAFGEVEYEEEEAAEAVEIEEPEEPVEEEDAFDYSASAFAQEEETLSETEEQEEETEEEEQQAAVAHEKAEEAPPVRSSTSTVQPPLRRRGVYTHSSSVSGAPLRTVVRRPAARSVEEIEARAEAITGVQSKAAVAAKAESKPAAKETAAKTRTPAKRAPAKKAASKPQARVTQPKAAKNRAPAKTVEPEEAGLPLKRKYVILNRRSAASVFNDYLNQKREQEKAELTGSLNTIIIK